MSAPDLNFNWPSDRISDDHPVEDRIHNAVLAERERCAKIADKLFNCIIEPEPNDPKDDYGYGIRRCAETIAAEIRLGKDRGSDPPQAETK